MSNWRKRLTGAALAGLFLVCVPLNPAWGVGIDTATVGVYDAADGVLNAVDASATAYNVALFTADVLAAYNVDKGGVINFDDITFAGYDPQINATYGTNHNKTLILTSPNNVGALVLTAVTDTVPISGSKGLDREGTGSGFDLNFDTQFAALGVTVLSDDVLDLNVTVRVTLANNNVVAVNGFAIAKGDHDTFFGFQAAGGQRIKRLEVLEAGSKAVYIDDLGFVVPEPSTALLLAMGLAIFGARRRFKS